PDEGASGTRRGFQARASPPEWKDEWYRHENRAGNRRVSQARSRSRPRAPAENRPSFPPALHPRRSIRFRESSSSFPAYFILDLDGISKQIIQFNAPALLPVVHVQRASGTYTFACLDLRSPQPKADLPLGRQVFKCRR